jgi:FSR family fosmidomycin resistance protein-like MFS transporter
VTSLPVLITLSLCHLLNDLLQALLPAIYPMLKDDFGLSFAQIGLITLASQVTSSLLQPVVGYYTDRNPQPFSLAIGMMFTLAGLLLLAYGQHFAVILLAAAIAGVGSSIFHPESSRIARLASGGRHGFAQSLFQTGGNVGSSFGPLLAALIVLPHGRSSLAWFSVIALIALALLWRIGQWYALLRLERAKAGTRRAAPQPINRRARKALAVLLALVFSKYIYLASLSSYFMFFLIERFHISVGSAQLHLFAFLAAVGAGTFIGGPIGDRFGRKYVIWGSILGVLPFTLALPYVSLFWTGVLSVIIGLILASAFSAILVFAQELVPGRVGLVAGLFFGFAFGIGGLGAAALGRLADAYGIVTVYHVCAFLPALGLLAAWLPDQGPTSSPR